MPSLSRRSSMRTAEREIFERSVKFSFRSIVVLPRDSHDEVTSAVEARNDQLKVGSHGLELHAVPARRIDIRAVVLKCHAAAADGEVEWTVLPERIAAPRPVRHLGHTTRARVVVASDALNREAAGDRSDAHRIVACGDAD